MMYLPRSDGHYTDGLLWLLAFNLAGAMIGVGVMAINNALPRQPYTPPAHTFRPTLEQLSPAGVIMLAILFAAAYYLFWALGLFGEEQ